ncbi:MAG: CPBP family intramembrane metalloprotease, partial [Lachnospiraceae bacterium]|nr:CPBP family intramembrane metalloprotease [Lachnospiraceae bacterium]
YSGSLLPCIITHSAINTLSTFANGAALTAERQIIYTIVTTVLAVAYTLILTKTLSKNQLQQ